MRDPYRVLYVTPDAPQEVVEAAHRALVRLLHPDVAGVASTSRMARVNAAMDLLRDPATRRRIDAELVTPRQSHRPAASSSRMPFGRYRGTPLGELPADYLEWLAGLPDLKPGLRDDVAAVRRWRRAA
jgi:curved DNA-binding protein CbpA